ncbi:hypothetical protein Kpho01_26970 [Kitasatospora phosalacinea]|uniref:Uncharacterized protein n=2 Tax=Kitasatospora phosalacinea TaxID=2065 RepID=A0A9W6ULR4_9ACTN|nr:hypothetical protein Kpho01_26970 [Kitasatospora phosalacinea]
MSAMDSNAEQQHSTTTASTDYAHGQLARAFATALSHPDPATRSRADARAGRWRAVLAGMLDGSLRIGSRTPVAGLPAWVTPEVERGGFATGRACAEGPLQPYEVAACRAAGIPEGRAELFAYSLTEAGLAGLWALLDSGRYRVTVPEEAALLTVAWLVRVGEQSAALQLVGVLAPFAARLRFTPPPGDSAGAAHDAVHRRSVGDAVTALASRRPNRSVESQREALTVWLPFSDELLAHWLEATEDGQPLDADPGPEWRRRGAELLLRYRTLAAAHPLCGKHRRHGTNLAVLRSALETAATGEPLNPRLRGLLRAAVDGMVRKRGLPGSETHSALRATQAEQAALPSHHAIAQVLLSRLAVLGQGDGLADPDAVLMPVTAAEAAESGVPAGAAVPAALFKPVLAATSAPVETLVERGLVPSAEVLAELAPQLAAAAEAGAHADPALRGLVSAGHRAFAGRRSLLLLDYAHQVRAEELPWVRAVGPYRSGDPAAQQSGLAALRRLGELAVGTFPGTILPNPLISELAGLARRADSALPFTEELAADIFMGGFTPKFAAAAGIAAGLLEGTLYERYFGIDYAGVWALAQRAEEDRERSVVAREFSELCRRRAGSPARRGSVAANGTVIEQAQILTTHNLAVLAGPVGVVPTGGWSAAALGAFTTARRLVALAERLPRPLPVVKNAAFAWRQLVFHLSLCPPQEQAAVLAEIERDHPPRLAPAVAGLQLATAGGGVEPDGADGRRFLGWTVGPHWLLRR